MDEEVGIIEQIAIAIVLIITFGSIIYGIYLNFTLSPEERAENRDAIQYIDEIDARNGFPHFPQSIF